MAELNPIAGGYVELTKPIVTVWAGQLRRARDAKAVFNSRSDQVMAFYNGAAGAMWEPDYINKFMGGAGKITPPKFKITLNVAFEQVAIFGPLLFWQMSDRKVKAYEALQIDPNLLAGGDPQAAEYFNGLAQQQAMDDARNELRATLFEKSLNYCQREQPGGGLAPHAKLVVFEALTKGAGFLRTEDYKFPFSDRTMVGSFFQPTDDIFVDPDCRDPLWQTARWVAIRHYSKWFELEEHFHLPPGSLRQYGSSTSQGAAYQAGAPSTVKADVTKDLVEWYEVFSRAGFGNKLAGTKQPIEPEFDTARGQVDVNGKVINDDFVYLAICPNCSYPLNLTSNSLVQEWADNSYIKQQTDWPTEFWRDNKWPVEMLSFYPHSGTSPWPEPPLAPALGELTCLNILMSAYIQQAWEGRQTVVAVREGAIANLQSLLTADISPLAIELKPQFNEKIAEVLEFMKRPPVNGDLIQSIEFVIGLIEKRTGLSPVLYGQSAGANPRSATEYQGRADTVNIRPEYMQKQVAAFHSNVADKELFCQYIHMASADIKEQLGPLGVVAWDELVTREDPEAILRGSKCIVEASDIRRPNKAKDTADLQGMQQYLLPILAGQMAQSGDVGPLNGFIQAIGDASEIDVHPFLFPPQQPNEVAQQMQQAELGKVQAETGKLTADAQKSMADAQATAMQGQSAAQDAELKAQVAIHGADLKARTAEHGLAIKQQAAEHAAGLKERQTQLAEVATQQEMLNKQGVHEQTMEERMQQARQALGLKIMQSQMGMQQNAETHENATAIADDKAQNDARRGNLITYQKMLMNAAEHAQRLNQQAAGSRNE